MEGEVWGGQGPNWAVEPNYDDVISRRLLNQVSLSCWQEPVTGPYPELYVLFKPYVRWILNLNSVNQLIFVMVKCGVLFEVRTEFLNNI
jgi:hypothetical protein